MCEQFRIRGRSEGVVPQPLWKFGEIGESHSKTAKKEADDRHPTAPVPN
jgi:hypothetical protein